MTTICFRVIVKGVEGVEKFGLCPLLARDELYIVDQQDIHLTETVSEIIHFFETKGIDQLVRKFLRGGIGDTADIRALAGKERITDGVEEMCFPEAHPPIDKEGIIHLSRIVRDGKARRVCKLVARAHDERFKCISRLKKIGRRLLLEGDVLLLDPRFFLS